MIKPPLSGYASVKSILVLAALVLAINLIVRPFFSGEKSNPPIDLQIAYTPYQAYKLIDNMSANDRRNYMIGEMTIDVIYPIIYTFLFSFILLLLFPKNLIIPFLPYGAMFSDFFENFGIVSMLWHYPDKLMYVGWITSVFSSLKWIFVAISVFLIVIGIAKKLIVKIKTA